MSFNMHFYRALKVASHPTTSCWLFSAFCAWMPAADTGRAGVQWVLITPFLAMSGVLFFVKDMQHVLPL